MDLNYTHRTKSGDWSTNPQTDTHTHKEPKDTLLIHGTDKEKGTQGRRRDTPEGKGLRGGPGASAGQDVWSQGSAFRQVGADDSKATLLCKEGTPVPVRLCTPRCSLQPLPSAKAALLCRREEA